MAAGDYDVWLLDLDGTLVDVREDYRRSVVSTVGDRLDRRFSEREADYLWYGVGDARERVLESAGVSPTRFWDVFHEVDEPRARAEASFLYEDAARVVPELEGPVGLVTHCPRSVTEPLLSHLDMRSWFDAVVCCSEATGWKPDAGPVERALADLGVEAEHSAGVLAGDDPQDVGAAHNAGLASVHVRRPHRTQAACPDADRQVASLTELLT